ncbi:hypothetical protein [Selenomonas infelix]|uniref:hypothetical protein n=1 Tax=Selenomonas infelix TaxID=135082 RepID=UPI001FDEA3D9|nr:hypothetical protein [Selenomonas infelix]
MEEVLKKAEAEAGIWKRRLCSLGRKPKKQDENCWRDCLRSVHLYVRFLYSADSWKSVRSSGGLDSAFVAFINCTMWVGYGFFKEHRDWPLVIANSPGIIFGLTAA